MSKAIKRSEMGALETTSYRYEMIKPQENWMEYGFTDSKRFGDVTRFIGFEDTQAEYQKALRAAEWAEGLEEKSMSKLVSHGMKQLKGEVTSANAASLIVRRAALKLLLQSDYLLYERELNLQDKAFYKERI